MKRAPMILLLAALAASCSDSTEPSTGPATLELTVTGDFSSYETATVKVDGREVGLMIGDTELTVSVPDVPLGEVPLEFKLTKSVEATSSGQTAVRFDRARASVSFDGAPVRISESGFEEVTARLELSSAGATASLADDPCVLETAVATSASYVDVDRALYRDSFADLITFVFAVSDDYDGGNLFDLVADVGEYESVCAGAEWSLADTLICVEIEGELGCFHFQWER